MHDQQFEQLVHSLSRRLWRGVVLPGIGLQLMLFMAFSCVLGVAKLSADEPPVVVALLPDAGLPPAPAIDTETVETQAAVSAADAPAAEPTASAETAEPAAPPAETPPAVEPTAPATVAEVTSDEQVKQSVESAAKPAEVRELSVEPAVQTRPVLPVDRPAWVGAPNDTSERVHRLYVTSFTAGSREEVEKEEMLDEPMVAAVRLYLDEMFPGQNAWKLRVTSDFIRHNLLDKSTDYVVETIRPTGPEYQKWVILQVSPEQREYFAAQLRELKQQQRMSILGVGLAAVLGMTGLLNLAFNRRRRRYPNAVAPITMAIMPGNGHNGLQHVAAGGAPVVMVDAPRPKRSFLRKTLILLLCAGLVFALLLPAITVVKLTPQPQPVGVPGHVYELNVRQPFMEKILSDHD